MRIEVGKTYRNRADQYVTIVAKLNCSAYPYKGSTDQTYTEHGIHCVGCSSRDDLIEEVPLPKQEVTEDQHAPGAKLDDGKVRANLVEEYFPNTLLLLNALCTVGAIKYTSGGFRTVPNGIERYKAAAGRHAIKRARGELKDDETLCPHEIAVIWNKMAAFELTLSSMEVDTNSAVDEVISAMINNANEKWGSD